ncbi:MAG: DUF3575 domain-containing protein [Flavobacteriaceae bacterium]|nr:DUF3575 domain-containing protein [Flavobacteriaceae bacterium]
MKQFLLYFFILFLFLGVYAQEETYDEEVTKVEIVKDSSFDYADSYGSHEIRLNALDLVVHPAIHIYYERIVDSSNGYGVSVFANFGDNEATYQNFAVTPYYRFYFLNRKDFGASGLFIEVFSSFASVNFDEYYYNNSERSDDEFQFSMGVGIGKKWVNRNGFSFEVSAGFGRYFTKSDSGYEPEGHGRIGLAIGKRF